MNNTFLRLLAGSIALLLLPLCLRAIPLPTAPGWDSGFDGQRAWQHDRFLASDTCRGRYSGFAGSDVADRYISGQFAADGLEKPFGADGYFHRFAYGAGEYTMPSSLVFHFKDGHSDTAKFWRDLNIFKYSGYGKVSGRVVFVGYGVSAPDKGWDDYAGLDVRGAIVFAWRGGPDLPNVRWDKELFSGSKTSMALSKGAVGFINCETNPPKYATIMEEFYHEKLPAVWISKSMADSILAGTGKTKDQWKQLCDSTKTSVSRVLDVTADLQVSGKYYPRRKTDNLAGLLIGSDPVLKNEVVVIGAHMDHHGVDAAGNIYPGADDNASGASAMMELARIFSERKERPKRSLLFIGFACEEEGLCGSAAFVKDPRLPNGMSMVAMLNMDMVGQGNCSLGVGGISEFPLLGEAMFASWPDSALKQLEFWGLYEGSDHDSFRDAGIPTYVIGARGDHPNYHTPGDSAANIKPEVLKATGDMVYHCALALADWPQPIKPLVSKGQWLVNKYGGVKRESYEGLWHPQPTVKDNEHMDVQSDLSTPKMATVSSDSARQFDLYFFRNSKEAAPGRVVGVEYNYPLEIALLEPTPRLRWAEIYLPAVEFVRSNSAGRGFPILADSVRKDYKGEPFRGVATAIYYDCFPSDTLELLALARAGVGFVTSHGGMFVGDSLRLEDWNENAKYVRGWRGMAKDSRLAGLRLWMDLRNYVPSQRRNDQHYNDYFKKNLQAVIQLAQLWDGQEVCDVSMSSDTPNEFLSGMLPSPELDSLLFSGCFLISNDVGYIKSHLAKPDFVRIGIPTDPKFVETLLDQGFTETQIGDLLFGNLQRTLQKWWADPEYTRLIP